MQSERNVIRQTFEIEVLKTFREILAKENLGFAMCY